MMVLFARNADRVGKVISGAPPYPLVADLKPKEIGGKAEGLRQEHDSVGAFVGPAVAIGLMHLFAVIGRLFWLAAIPAAIAFVCVLVGVVDRAAPA
jgi:hypothetical protein